MSSEPLLGGVGTYQNEPITTMITFATWAGSFCHWEKRQCKTKHLTLWFVRGVLSMPQFQFGLCRYAHMKLFY